MDYRHFKTSLATLAIATITGCAILRSNNRELTFYAGNYTSVVNISYGEDRVSCVDNPDLIDHLPFSSSPGQPDEASIITAGQERRYRRAKDVDLLCQEIWPRAVTMTRKYIDLFKEATRVGAVTFAQKRSAKQDSYREITYEPDYFGVITTLNNGTDITVGLNSEGTTNYFSVTKNKKVIVRIDEVQGEIPKWLAKDLENLAADAVRAVERKNVEEIIGDSFTSTASH